MPDFNFYDENNQALQKCAVVTHDSLGSLAVAILASKVNLSEATDYDEFQRLFYCLSFLSFSTICGTHKITVISNASPIGASHIFAIRCVYASAAFSFSIQSGVGCLSCTFSFILWKPAANSSRSCTASSGKCGLPSSPYVTISSTRSNCCSSSAVNIMPSSFSFLALVLSL